MKKDKLEAKKEKILQKLESADTKGLGISNFGGKTDFREKAIKALLEENMIAFIKISRNNKYFTRQHFDTVIDFYNSTINVIENKVFLDVDLLQGKHIRKKVNEHLEKEKGLFLAPVYNTAFNQLINEKKLIELTYSKPKKLYALYSKLVDKTVAEDVASKDALTRDDVLRAYNKIKQKSGGISTVEIYALKKELKVSIESLHDFIIEEAKAGKAELHKGDWSKSSEQVRSAVIEINGGKFLLVKIK